MKKTYTMLLLSCLVYTATAQPINDSLIHSKERTMRILYVFPHPDDESFGPAPVIKQQVEQGHEVFLLTLTKGGATKARHKLGLTIEQMGEVRYKEMQKVEKVLGLSGMMVLDFPDGGLQDMNPLDLEKALT